MRPLLYGDPVKPYEIIVGLCICGRHRKSNAAISRARRKFNQTLAPYRHNAAVESDLAPRFGGCAAGFGLGRAFTLSARSGQSRTFQKAVVQCLLNTLSYAFSDEIDDRLNVLCDLRLD